MADHESMNTLHESHDLFKREHDEQLVQWMNRRPDDWTLSAGGSGTIYGWGHNHRGQLGGIEGAKVKVPTSTEALATLRPIQLIGGEQTLFAVTADGKVCLLEPLLHNYCRVIHKNASLPPTLAHFFFPVLVYSMKPFKEVNSYYEYFLRVQKDGSVFFPPSISELS